VLHIYIYIYIYIYDISRLRVKILGWTSLPHTPYNAELASSDFHLLGALKGAILGKRFASYDSVMEEMKKWLRLF